MVGKLPPGETDVTKMIPTGDTGPKGAVKRRRAEETGEPLYKAQQKTTVSRTQGSDVKDTTSAATTPIQATDEETKPSASDIKRIGTRDPSRVKYPMHWLVFVVLWGYLQGMTSCVQIAALWNSNYELLASRFVDFPKHKISHDTVLRLIKAIGRFKLWLVLRLFTENIIVNIEEFYRKNNINYNNSSPNKEDNIFDKTIYPVDGKSFNACPVRPGGKKQRYILNMFDSKHQLVVEIILVGEKTNEITYCVEIIDGIDLRDGIVTVDALNSTGKFSKKITDQGGDYCFAIKENYSKIYANLRELFKKYETSDLMKHAEKNGKEHGRMEERHAYVLPAYLLEEEFQDHWSGLQHGSIVMNVQRRLELTKDTKSNEDVRYFISSLCRVGAHVTMCAPHRSGRADFPHPAPS